MTTKLKTYANRNDKLGRTREITVNHRYRWLDKAEYTNIFLTTPIVSHAFTRIINGEPRRDYQPRNYDFLVYKNTGIAHISDSITNILIASTREEFDQLVERVKANAAENWKYIDPKPFKVRILWGESPDPDSTPVEYEFVTEAELNAFMHGVAEADGWLGCDWVRPNADGTWPELKPDSDEEEDPEEVDEEDEDDE